MKRIKILSLLLCLSMLCAMFTPGTLAQEDEAPDNGMKVSKTATANGDGTYTVTLEAYATGSKVISEVPRMLFWCLTCQAPWITKSVL